LLFLVFPFLIWAALRFQLAGAAPCSLIVSVCAIQATAAGAGPFAGHTLLARMVTLQAFNGSTALTALLLSAIIAERNRTRQQIELICTQLAEVVVRLAPGDVLRQWPPPRHGERPPDER
ncbi:MASE1 domain-containing protein, partial [Streptomyces sp. MCAF7]